jgi:nicotinamide-nucleotide amidase
MRAAILAIGSELLGVDRLDTNSLRLTRELQRHGVELIGKGVVGDDAAEVTSSIERWLERVDLLLVTGGLGPTTDDLTREAVAAALSRELYLEANLVTDIERKFAAMGLEMPIANRSQAEVIDGADVLPNPRGTAPGLRLQEDARTIFLFPGVPRELDLMVENHLAPWLEQQGFGVELESRSLRVSCRSESAVEDDLQPLYGEFEPRTITILAQPGDIEVRFTVSGAAGERADLLERMMSRGRELLGRSVYSEESKATLEEVVGAHLTRLGRTVSTAESCTAGMLAERLTRVSGSSAYFLGGVVSYADRIKTELLGVPGELLADDGAVSRSVAEAMASGVRQRLGSDYGVGITGIAGPGGGSPEKPVGTVHVALAGPGDDGISLTHRHLRLPGDRQRIRRLSSQWALELLRRALSV